MLNQPQARPNVQSPSGTEIRRGNPFADGSLRPLEAVAQRPAAELPLDTTLAGGCLLAAVLIVPESVLGAAWFPAGGMVVAAAGVVLSVSAWPTRRWGWIAVAATLHVLVLGIAAWQIWFNAA